MNWVSCLFEVEFLSLSLSFWLNLAMLQKSHHTALAGTEYDCGLLSHGSLGRALTVSSILGQKQRLAQVRGLGIKIPLTLLALLPLGFPL